MVADEPLNLKAERVGNYKQSIENVVKSTSDNLAKQKKN